MSTQTLPATDRDPESPPEHLLAPVRPAPALPRSPQAAPPDGWPAEAHLPDDREDDTC